MRRKIVITRLFERNRAEKKCEKVGCIKIQKNRKEKVVTLIFKTAHISQENVFIFYVEFMLLQKCFYAFINYFCLARVVVAHRWHKYSR